jgi:hypothetical protein
VYRVCQGFERFDSRLGSIERKGGDYLRQCGEM